MKTYKFYTSWRNHYGQIRQRVVHVRGNNEQGAEDLAFDAIEGHDRMISKHPIKR